MEAASDAESKCVSPICFRDPKLHSALVPDMTPLPEKDVLLALRQWHRGGSPPPTFAPLLHSQQECIATTGNEAAALDALLTRAIRLLEADYPLYGQLLNLRYRDGQAVQQVAYKLSVAESTLYAYQKSAVVELTKQLQRLAQEMKATRLDTLTRWLKTPQDVTVVGIEQQLSTLVQKLGPSDAPWIVAVEGIGGIGKTTFADRLVRNCIEQEPSWRQVVWVTVKQSTLMLDGSLASVAAADGSAPTVAHVVDQLLDQLLPDVPKPPALLSEQTIQLLRSHLETYRSLIVIDNLETLGDAVELVPLLRQLAKPSKFILTSRQSDYAARDVYHYALKELDEADALQLVRQEAAASNLASVTAASDAELRPIYDLVGGNPLALRLVTGQLHLLGLEMLLRDLKEARGQSIENLYAYIYRDAWARLDEESRQTLMAMLLVRPTGETLEEIGSYAGLGDAALRSAIQQLIRLNLLESFGTLQRRLYGIHSLTRTFLHRQVLLWQEGDEA